MLEGQFIEGMEFDTHDVSRNIICFCFFIENENMLLVENAN